MSGVHTLDMSKLASASVVDLDAFATELLECFSTQGMVKLKNAPIPDEFIDGAFDMSREFFSLPTEEKSLIAHPEKANPNRGWVRVGQEKTYAISGIEKGKNQSGGPAVLNVKESFDMGDKDDPLWANRYPTEAALPQFRTFMDDFYATCHSTYTLILRAIERGFALKGLSVSIVDSGVNSSELRLNYYPTVDVRSVRGGTHTRISEHTDFGMVTLLFQDSVGGLEVADHVNEGQFISVEPESRTEILANVGDSLERLTNGYLKSISHRVTVPKSLMDAEDGLLRERYSFAYFGKAERERSLKPLAAFVDEDGGRPARWGDVTAYEWNQIKLGLSYG